MNTRNYSRTDETESPRATRMRSASPEMPEAEVLPETCEAHGLQFIHLIGSRVCACPNGCIYSYPQLEKKMQV